MADSVVGGGGGIDFVDKRRTQGAAAGVVGTPANYATVAAMRTRLAAINGTYYTAARLNNMTDNDMVYALRLNDDAAGI